MDISIILNCHREKILAYSTIRSLASSRKYAQKMGFSVETLVVLDKPDQETRELLSKYKENEELLIDKIYEISEGSLGAARNYGIQKANGQFICFMDGDDLCSENWIVEACIQCKSDLKTIAHPEINIFFDKDIHWWRHLDQMSNHFRATEFIYHNYWTALTFAHKSVYESLNYHVFTPSSGFGFEDWHWNCETIANGFIHKVIPETSHFIRKKNPASSLNFLAASSNCLIPPTKLFRSCNQKKDQSEEKLIFRKLKRFFLNYKNGVRSRTKELIFFSFFLPIKYLSPSLYSKFVFLKTKLAKRKSIHLPDWIIPQCENISSFEPLLFPSKQFLNKLSYVPYEPRHPDLSVCYFEAFGDWIENLDIIFLVPWLHRGGADLGCIHHANALSRKGAKVLVIATENSESPWASKLDDRIKFINFGNLTVKYNFSDELKTELLAKYLVQACPKKIHLINSRNGWDAVRKFGRSLVNNSQIFASLFCDDVTEEGEKVGYRTYLPETYSFLQKIFSDNSKYPLVLQNQYGLKKEFFETVPFPIDEKYIEVGRKRILSEVETKKIKPKVFWAGRLDRQKRPDILLQICKRLPDVEFFVWGASFLGSSTFAKELAELSNVKLMGPYDSILSVPTGEYNLYLYTSSWDGLPLAILDAAAVGLPIVSSIVGGISDFIDVTTGFPVFDVENINQYCEQINKVISDPKAANKIAANAILLLEGRHTFDKFEKSLEQVTNYLP